MPERAKTTKEIFAEDQKKNWQVLVNRPFWVKSSFLITLLFTIIVSTLAGYLGAVYYIDNHYPNGLINDQSQKIIDFTKKLSLNDPNYQIISNLTNQAVGIYKLKSGNQWWRQLYSASDFLGTGAIITSDGWIMTSDKVIPDLNNSEYAVVLPNGKNYTATEFISDPLTKVVFFKVDASNLQPIQFAETDYLIPAQQLLVVAAGGNLNNSQINVTNVESVKYYDINSTVDYFNSTEKQNDYLLINDTLDKSFEGALATDLYGQIVGIATTLDTDTTLETIIPASYLNQAVASLLANKTTIVRNYLGLNYLDLSQRLNLPGSLTGGLTAGALVIGSTEFGITAIKTDSPAKGVLETEDIVLKVSGQALDEDNNLTELIQSYAPGDKLYLTINRKGSEMDVEIN